MSENPEEISLDIEGTLVKCNKKELTENSDYFKVMLEGNFAEKSQNIIELKGVDLNAFNVILKILWDESHIIRNEDLLTVLETASMLQFDRIKSRCIELISEFMSPRNCLPMWIALDRLDVRPLNLKAKAMSLIEFPSIKNSESLLDLTLNELIRYLSNVQLCVGNEFEVFEACTKWYFENNSINNREEVMLELLNTIDFGVINEGYIKEMLLYPDVSSNETVKRLLNDVLSLRNGATEGVEAKSIEFFKSRRRESFHSPCLLVDNSTKKLKRRRGNVDFYYDKFKRKRQNTLLEIDGDLSEEWKKFKSVLLFDFKSETFTKVLDMSGRIIPDLEGYQLIGYKDCIFLFGGETHLGRGNWNYNFCVYDTIRERWQLKTKLPYERRHFECCISGDLLFIIGGIGSFRVIKDTMFYYKYETNQWSKSLILPCSGLQLKACDFRGRLFLLSLNDQCGYVFDASNHRFTRYPIRDGDGESIYPKKFSLFSYGEKVYAKGHNLIEIAILNDELIVSEARPGESYDNFDHVESVICDRFVYTLYSRAIDETTSVILEKLDLETMSCDVAFDGDSVELSKEVFGFSSKVKLFNLRYYSMVENDCYLRS